METTNKFYDKFMKEIGARLYEPGFFKTIFTYVIDSKFRYRKQIDKWLKEQVDEYSFKTKALALSLRGKTPDETIVNILKWVVKNITYKTDYDNHGKIEYWGTADETIRDGAEDCDGMNSLIYVLARLAGISPLIMWNCIGDTSSGGHYWLVYFSTKWNKWVSIDASYWANKSDMKFRPKFKLTKSKYQNIWYMFNEEIVYKPI